MNQGTAVTLAPPRHRALRAVNQRPRHGTERASRHGIRFLRWPHEGPKREPLLQNRIPILWVVESAYPPPECLDPLEDWVRLPLAQDDIDARVACLAQRARNEMTPVIGPDNVLYTRQGRLPLADSEAVIMTALVENFQRLVPRKELVECGWGKASDEYRNALDLRILRLRRRIAPLGLEIKTVWGRGYMLETA